VDSTLAWFQYGVLLANCHGLSGTLESSSAFGSLFRVRVAVRKSADDEPMHFCGREMAAIENLHRMWGMGGRILLLMALFSGASSGQTSPSKPKNLSLEDALNYALQHYPAVRVSLEQLSAARAGISLARSQYLPQLSGVYQVSRATQNQVPGIWLSTAITPTVEGPVSDSSGQSYWGSQAGTLFSWEPVDFGLRPAMVSRAKSAESKSEADVAVTRLQVATAVGNYFLIALTSERVVAAAQANVNRWEAVNKSVHVLVDNTLRPGADASRADAQLALARTQLYQAQGSEESTLATLAALMGTAGTDLKIDAGNLLEPPPSISVPSAGIADHPAARDQLALVQEAQAQENVLNRTDYPRLFLQAEGFGRGSEVPDNGTTIGNWNGAAPARGNWVAGITITFPNVFDFKALGAEKQMARANERSQQALYDKTVQDLTGEVQAALSQLKSAQLVAQQTPVELAAARESETQSRARYQSGLATLVEVADAENLLAQAEMDNTVARLNVWRRLFGVASAQGNLQSFLQVLHGVTPGGN
jgi:outer membrane protein